MSVHQVSAAPEPPLAPLPAVAALAEDTARGVADKQSLLDDFFDDALEVCKLSYGAGPRFCKSGLHSMPSNVDFCGECGVFEDDILICPICRSPGKKQLNPKLEQFCRGRFNLVPCNVDNQPRKVKFGPPLPIDFKNAKERFTRLQQREAERASGSHRAYTVTLSPTSSAEEAGLPFTSSTAPPCPWPHPLD